IGLLEGHTGVSAGNSGANAARAVGEAKLVLGDRVGAREALDRSLAWATSIRYRPEIALTRLALSELLLEGVSSHDSLGQHAASSSPGSGSPSAVDPAGE